VSEQTLNRLCSRTLDHAFPSCLKMSAATITIDHRFAVVHIFAVPAIMAASVTASSLPTAALLPPMSGWQLAGNALMSGFFTAFSLLDLSFSTYALEMWDAPFAGMSGASLARQYYTWKTRQPIIPVVMTGLGLLLPLSVVALVKKDVLGLLLRPAQRARHAWGTVTLVTLCFVLYWVVLVIKPAEAAVAAGMVTHMRGSTPAAEAAVRQLRRYHTVLLVANLVMIVAAFAKYGACNQNPSAVVRPAASAAQKPSTNSAAASAPVTSEPASEPESPASASQTTASTMTWTPDWSGIDAAPETPGTGEASEGAHGAAAKKRRRRKHKNRVAAELALA
jgi:hypothetical protein